MAITKTNFIDYTRCRRYSALENIRKDKLDSKMTIEEYMKENEKEEYRELLGSMFESTDEGETDLTKKEDKELSAMMKYYKEVELESAFKSKRLFNGKFVYSENTYIQNSGVSYGKKDVFDVVSILDGTVIGVKEDNLLGKIIEIRHSNDVISVYQSLSEVNYKLNDNVMQGAVIGKSGMSSLSPELNNHLHFELFVKGINVNPENYYDKKLADL